MAIIITGNPGVGKHTVAKSIGKILKYKILDINQIALESGVYEKNDETIDVDIKKLKNILKNKIKSYQIDTTSKSVPKITKAVISSLKGKFKNDKVDWLTLVSKKNDLKKFFPY